MHCISVRTGGGRPWPAQSSYPDVCHVTGPVTSRGQTLYSGIAQAPNTGNGLAPRDVDTLNETHRCAACKWLLLTSANCSRLTLYFSADKGTVFPELAHPRRLTERRSWMPRAREPHRRNILNDPGRLTSTIAHLYTEQRGM